MCSAFYFKITKTQKRRMIWLAGKMTDGSSAWLLRKLITDAYESHPERHELTDRTKLPDLPGQLVLEFDKE